MPLHLPGDTRIRTLDRASSLVIVSPRRIVPGVTTLALRPRRRSCLPDADVDEAQRLLAEAGGELGAAGVRLLGDLDDGVADGEARAGRQVVGAEVEVDVQLVAGEGADVVVVTADEPGQAGVDDVELHVGVGAAVLGAAAAANVPGVADDTVGGRQLGLVEHLAAVDHRPADDQFERPVVLRGAADVVEPGFQRRGVEVDRGDGGNLARRSSPSSLAARARPPTDGRFPSTIVSRSGTAAQSSRRLSGRPGRPTARCARARRRRAGSGTPTPARRRRW